MAGEQESPARTGGSSSKMEMGRGTPDGRDIGGARPREDVTSSGGEGPLTSGTQRTFGPVVPQKNRREYVHAETCVDRDVNSES